jgi:hypothetical protein
MIGLPEEGEAIFASAYEEEATRLAHHAMLGNIPREAGAERERDLV